MMEPQKGKETIRPDRSRELILRTVAKTEYALRLALQQVTNLESSCTLASITQRAIY